MTKREDETGEYSFDELTKGLASGTISRGRALKLAGAAILGSTGLLVLFPGKAQAQGCAEDEPAINNRHCQINPCGSGPFCSCAETVNGTNRCVDFARLSECPARDECDRNRDCRRGQLCIKIGGCCEGRRLNLCVPVC